MANKIIIMITVVLKHVLLLAVERIILCNYPVKKKKSSNESVLESGSKKQEQK